MRKAVELGAFVAAAVRAILAVVFLFEGAIAGAANTFLNAWIGAENIAFGEHFRPRRRR